MSQYASRAEYFRNRRKKIAQLTVNVPRERLDAFNVKLAQQGKTKTQWLNEKIIEELNK